MPDYTNQYSTLIKRINLLTVATVTLYTIYSFFLIILLPNVFFHSFIAWKYNIIALYIESEHILFLFKVWYLEINYLDKLNFAK